MYKTQRTLPVQHPCTARPITLTRHCLHHARSLLHSKAAVRCRTHGFKFRPNICCHAASRCRRHTTLSTMTANADSITITWNPKFVVLCHINPTAKQCCHRRQARYRYIRRGINFACRITAVCVKRLPMGWFIVILRKIVRPLSTVNGLLTNPDMNR